MATYWENSCSFGLRYVSWYKYLIVSLVFSHLGFWSGNLFLIAPFPDLCLLVPFYGPSPFSLMFSLLLNELSFTFYLLIGNALQRLSSLLAKILIKTYMKKKQLIVEFLKGKETFEPPHGKTNNLHRRKQRRRSASQ